MFKLIFGLTPGWIKNVEKNGRSAVAVVLSDPKEALKGIAHYEGRDAWIDVKARVELADAPPYKSAMKCRLSQALFGMLEVGMRVNVKVDPRDIKHVLLADDANTLLSRRVKK